MHLHPNCTEPHLDTSLLDSGFEIESFAVLGVEQEAAVTGLLAWDDFDMEFSAFIDVADNSFNHDVPRDVAASEEDVCFSAEMYIIIEASMSYLLDRVRAR